DGTVALPRPLSLGGRLAVPRVRSIGGPLSGRIALGSLILGAAVLVVFTSARPSVLVPHSLEVFPNWEAGPLHPLFSGLYANATALRTGYSLLAIAMMAAYG